MSKALELAKECAGYGGGKIVMFTHDELEQFYRLAQAQALREWAREAEGYTNPLKLANDMEHAADDLEKQA